MSPSNGSGSQVNIPPLDLEGAKSWGTELPEMSVPLPYVCSFLRCPLYPLSFLKYWQPRDISFECKASSHYAAHKLTVFKHGSKTPTLSALGVRYRFGF